jgi:hypothetical protein
MKLRLFLTAMLVLSASSGLSQKREEKPKLHADFYFGGYPVYRDAITTMAKEDVRLLMVESRQVIRGSGGRTAGR